MRCAACGYLSLEEREHCPRCGQGRDSSTRPARPGAGPAGLRLDPEPAAGTPGSEPVAELVLPRSEPGTDEHAVFASFADDENLPEMDGSARPAPGRDDLGPHFSLEDDLIPPVLPPRGAEASAAWARDGRPGVAEGERPGVIIDREEALPEQFWAAEGAGLGRRAAAAAVDGLALALALAVFATGAWLALRLGGLGAAELLGEEVLRAVALPFGLLGLLLSFGYSVFFHSLSGRTPGKLLAGLELRTVDGDALTGARLVRRWAGAVLAAGAAGAGVLWALFEPRRRGWADLISGTVIAERRRGERRAGEGADGLPTA